MKRKKQISFFSQFQSYKDLIKKSERDLARFMQNNNGDDLMNVILSLNAVYDWAKKDNNIGFYVQENIEKEIKSFKSKLPDSFNPDNSIHLICLIRIIANNAKHFGTDEIETTINIDSAGSFNYAHFNTQPFNQSTTGLKVGEYTILINIALSQLIGFWLSLENRINSNENI